MKKRFVSFGFTFCIAVIKLEAWLPCKAMRQAQQRLAEPHRGEKLAGACRGPSITKV